MKTERRQIGKEMREAEKQKQFDLKQKKKEGEAQRSLRGKSI